MKISTIIWSASILAVVAAIWAPIVAHAAAPTRPVIAIIDTGVTPLSTWMDARVLPGYDFVDGDNDPSDENGHGTEMAEIALSRCPTCRILPVRVLGQGGIGQSATIMQGVQWAVAHGANVINLSMSSGGDTPAEDAVIEDAVHAGVTVVIAAGNDGQSYGYPAASSPDAIKVGSIHPDGTRYTWSNYGPWVSVWAQGSFVVTSMFGVSGPVLGTSGSTAMVSGLAGTLIGQGSATTPAQVLAALQTKMPTVPQ